MKLGPIDLSAFGYTAAFAGMAIAFMFIGKLIFNALTPFNDDKEIIEKKNLPVALRTVGMMVGLVIGMAGALSGPSAGFDQDLREFMVDGFVVIGALLVAKVMLRAITLRGFPVTESIREGNLAVGFAEFGAFVATGLILNGSFADEGGALWGGALYAMIGQFALALSFFLYEWISPIHVVKELKSGNRAAGLLIGGRLVATGMILQAAISGPMTDWSTDLTLFGAYFAFGMVLLGVASFVADLVFLPGIRVRDAIENDQNVAAVVKVVGVQLAVAALVMTTL